jgi:hypothetical protein
MAELREEITGGKSIATFAKERGINYGTLRDWVDADPGRASIYARAREDRADTFADAIREISEETAVEARHQGEEIVLGLSQAVIAHNRLRIDSLKWLASKMKPRVYGEKLEVEGKLALSFEDHVKAINADVPPPHAAIPNV